MPKRKNETGGQQKSPDLAALFEPYVWSWFAETFGSPSPPQAAAWPRIAEGRSTLIFSPTGSGKTLAAFLWCINELYRLGSAGALTDAIHVLYVSPLKALNNDIQRNLVEPLAGIRRAARAARVRVPAVRSAVRTGDTTPAERQAMTRRPPHIFITTPESLYILLATQKMRRHLRGVRYVIVDEIHAISDNKRGVHLSLSLERLAAYAGREPVRIGLSATQKPLEAVADFLVGCEPGGRPRPCEIVDVGARKDLNVRVITPVDNLLEAPFDAIWSSAYDKMLAEVRGHETTLIFTNSRYKTERTALRLNERSADEPVRVGAHHGSMSREVRLEIEGKLKAGQVDALVATSSLELGIDVGSIDLVCQVESPKSVSRGLQRIGRAGHLLTATSEGRLLVTDRDDLVESAVLVRAILDGRIDTTRIPTGCLDVLAQQIVGAVAADDWRADDLFALCRRSYCFRTLERADFDRVLEMLAGRFPFEIDMPPFPKLSWDRVNGVLSAERGTRMIAFRAGGTIPEVSNYDVYFEAKKTRVGSLDEGFVERLGIGDIFLLGSSSWRVLGIRRNRVIVEDVYGRAPTIPFWGGERDSRTADLGALVGRFRRELAARLAAGDPEAWLTAEYGADDNGAKSIHEYFREQQLAAGCVPSDERVLVEHFTDELGRRQVIVHASCGIRVHETWALALAWAIERRHGFRPQTATVDDGLLLTLPADAKLPLGAGDGSPLLALVTPKNVERILSEAVLDAPVFASRFRHNAVRSLLVLREYRGRKTPVWIQSLRAAALLEACRSAPDFPLLVETRRECLHEALDLPGLASVLEGIASGKVAVRTIESTVPSPFAHSLLLLGQYGDGGAIPTRERRSRLMHLHRELLRQILDAETLRNLLDRGVAEAVEARLQATDPRRRARTANELARVLGDVGDLVDEPDDALCLADRCETDAAELLAELVEQRRALRVPIPTVETNRHRWIATEDFPVYRAAFAAKGKLSAEDRRTLAELKARGPTAPSDSRVERLVAAYRVVCVRAGARPRYVAADAWVPRTILRERPSRDEARRALIARHVRTHGPVTPYEIMERYGLGDGFVRGALEALHAAGSAGRGEYLPTKSFPQWCHKPTLEEIHRRTLDGLRREMEPATPCEYADFLIRWQHAHPATRLAGLDGLREVIGRLQGLEGPQALWERRVLPLRVGDYDPSMLDRLCYGGEAFWRCFDDRFVGTPKRGLRVRRGRIGFCLRKDLDWLVPPPDALCNDPRRTDEDLADACHAVRAHLAERGACFFDDVVAATGLDWRIVLRAIWHLVWTGEATCDSYEAIRHAEMYTGLSGCYDLASTPTKKGVTADLIVRHMLEKRRLDPRLGRWAPTERLTPDAIAPPPPERRAEAWARLLLKRYGIVCRDVTGLEVGLPPWKDLRRALMRAELLGTVRRGYFVEGLAGEQYAAPEAVEALHDAKLRARAAENAEPADPEPMVLLSVYDPANPFGRLVPLVDETDVEQPFVKTAYCELIVQAGRPVLLHKDGVRLLADLPADRAREAIRLLLDAHDGELAVPNWNGHPIEVSAARHLLTTMGFVKVDNRWKGYVHDGANRPDEKALAEARRHVPAVFERAGKESAPVEYDAEWIVSRANEVIRPKVRELIDTLRRVLPAECEFDWRPRGFLVRYRGLRCINPYVQQKKIWVQVTHRGWVRGMEVTPETDVAGEAFVRELTARFEKTRRAIDELLDSRKGR